ncbi:uncharacterized protein LOC134719462 [Mytilus trossulus]|uniref:uncharacterized protein LOC134719462 n=1 Tax=Mytilus trossulus TaxID=6551 RepID=UPI0030043ED1
MKFRIIFVTILFIDITAQYSLYIKDETVSTENKRVIQSHTTDQLYIQNTTPIISSERDSVLQRPETLPSTNISRKKRRRRRFDYEDSHDWNYDLDDLDYDENNKEAMISVITKNWKTLLFKAFVCLCFFCFIVCCCYVCCKNMCRTICAFCGLFFSNCFNICRLCGCIKDDPAYNQMKFICKAMGMELDYKTYQNMKQSLEETIIEQGSDPNNLAKIAG